MSTKPTILLTGATGFLGSRMLEALLKENYPVVVLKRSTSNQWRIEHLTGRYKSYDLDIQPLKLAYEEQQIDCVIHTACHYGRNGDPIIDVVESNLMLGLKVLDVSLVHNVKTFINADSFLTRDLNTYSLSKKQLVDWLKQLSNSIKVVNLKIEHIYGPKDDATKLMAWIVSELEKNIPEINLTTGIQKRDFIYIDDVVSAFMCALESSGNFPDYYELEVGTGQSIEVKYFIENLKQVFDQLNGQTDSQLNFGVVPYRQGEIMEYKVDNRALRQLGWQPKVSLKQGLEQSLKEKKSNT